MRNSDLAAEARRQGLRGPIRVTTGTRRTALLDFLTQGSLDRLPECDVRTPGRGRGWERGRGRSHGHSHGRGRGRGQRHRDQRRPASAAADPEPEVAHDNAAAAGQFPRTNEPTASSSPRNAIGQFLLTNGPSSTPSQQGGAGRGRNRTTPAWMTAGGGHGDTPRPTEGRGRGDAGHDGPPSSSPRNQIEQFLSANSPGNTSSQHGGAGRGRSRTTPAWATAGGGRDDTPRPCVGRGGGTTRL